MTTIGRALATIISFTFLIGAIGAGVGYGLGTFDPDYYRSVFRFGQQPGFDPVSVGFGQGLTQGTAGGVVVGLAVVALFCWRDIRLNRVATQPVPSEESVNPGKVAKWLLLVTGSLLTLSCCVSSSYMYGWLTTEQNMYYRRYLEDRDALAPVLASDPAFAGVEIVQYSGGGAYLSGSVPTHADEERLRPLVVRAVGERHAKQVMGSVSVRR